MALNQGTTTSMSAVKNNSSHGVADPNAELQQHTLVQSYDPNKGEIQHVDTSYSKPRISCSSRQPAEPKDIEGVQITEVDRSWSARYREYRPHLVRAIILVVTTGWWISSVVLHRDDKNWVIPFLLWLAIASRVFFLYVSTSTFMNPLKWIWKNTTRPLINKIPNSLRLPAAALMIVAAIVVGSFAPSSTPQNNRKDRAVSLLGLCVFVLCLAITSRDRKKINWGTVIVGLLSQFVVAILVLRTTVGYDIFSFVANMAATLLGFSTKGVEFLTASPVPDLIKYWWLVLVAPAIVFFVSVVSVLFHIGILQWFVGKLATFFFWAMKVSGVEAVVAVASPFVGQGESAILIRPFVAHLTMAELHQIMTSGFSTISASVMIAYIRMGVNPEGLVAACVMSIPGSLAVSKIRYPETEETLTSGRVAIPKDDDHRSANILEAFAKGAWFGLKIAATIATTLLCIISLVACIDGFLGWVGGYLNINGPPLSLTLILGYLCYPITFLLGVSREGSDLVKVSELIGLKLVTNEFVAYDKLQSDGQYADLSDRSRLILTYALCGFASIGSLGTQIGVLSQIAPARGGDISRVAFSACVSGAISTFIGACFAGMLISE